jgi:hemoglobin
MKKDIQTREDIEQLVNLFYDKVKSDPVIGYIFTEVVKVNWQRHLPVMYSFWENTIFFTGGYSGNPMEVHKRLNKLVPLKAEFFDRWITLFTDTVDELFAGEKSSLAKQRAASISVIMQIKISKDPTGEKQNSL